MSGTANQPADGSLVAAVLAGQRDQFAVLVARYQPALLRVARSRLGRDQWAEDVVQETLLCAFRWLQSYDSRFSFRTWLWTILLNQCRRHLKKRSRQLLVRPWSDHGAGPGDFAAQLSSHESPCDQMLADERAQLLDALLLKLPEAQADALRLRFFGGLKFREIADAMNCSLSTAKNRVRWGLAKMADHLARDQVPGRSSLESRHASPDDV